MDFNRSSRGGEFVSVRGNNREAERTLAEAIEQIDIGGPSMIRSAAKNYESVTVIVDPADYDEVLEDIRDHDGETT